MSFWSRPAVPGEVVTDFDTGDPITWAWVVATNGDYGRDTTLPDRQRRYRIEAAIEAAIDTEWFQLSGD